MENTRTPVEFPGERNEIAKALFKAQSALGPLKKTETNPLYGSKYADLYGVLEAIKNALKDAGIVLIQGANINFGFGEGNIMDRTTFQVVSVETVLLHAESGQLVRNVLNMIPVPDVVSKDRDVRAVTPQTVGKTITYARRYALQALLGLAAEDDDANAASQPVTVPAAQPGVRDYNLREPITPKPPEPQGLPPVERVDGMTDIQGLLKNWRNKEYQDGAIIHFGTIGQYTIWTKDPDMVEEMEKVQGENIIVTGKRSKNKPNTFEVANWRGATIQEQNEG